MAFSVDIGNLIAHLNLDTSKYDRSLAGAELRMRKMGQRMQEIGRGMALKLTAPLVGAAALIARSNMKIESAFIGVQKTVDATAEQFEVLREELVDLSRVMPDSITNIMGVAEAAGQLGVAKQDITEFTRVMVMMGISTDLVARDAAMQLARFAGIMGMTVDDTERLGATIVGLGNSTKAMESEIVALAMRISGAGQTMKLTVPQVLGISAALAEVGVQAQLGGTQIQRLMTEMITAVISGNRHLQTFAKVSGVTADKFRDLMKADPMEAFNRAILGFTEMGQDGERPFETCWQAGHSDTENRRLKRDVGRWLGTDRRVQQETSVTGVTTSAFVESDQDHRREFQRLA
jgi:hypothetical protein